jgi:hypothetical protein
VLGQALTLLVSVALLAPWAWLGASLLPCGTAPERLAVGAAVGLGATVTCAHLLGLVHQLAAYGWIFAGVCALALAIRWHGRNALRSPSPTLDPGTRWLWLGLALVTAFELVPTLASCAPIGWDPAFHAILAEKIRRTGGLVHDWQPFEPIPVNYPLGSHLWVALVASASGQAVHHVFQVQHLFMQTLAAALVFAVASRVLECWRSALLSLLCYGLLGNWGTFYSYYQWGGLPTEICFVLFLALLWCALALRGWAQVALGTVLYGSILLIHHLSAAIVTLVLASYVVVAAATRAHDGLWQRIARTMVCTAIAYAWFIVPYAVRAAHLHGTQVVEFAEESRLSLPSLLQNLGVFVVLAGALGLWRMRATAGAGVSFLFVWTASLLLGYFALDYVYRFVMLLGTGRDFTAFTPSRIATVLSYPLCIAAGHGLESLRTWWIARSPARVTPTAASMTPGDRTGLPVLMLTAALIAVPRAITLSERHAYDPKAEALGAWLQQHTSQNAFILYRSSIAPRRWLPYLTWRAAEFTPVPASEDRAAVERKHDEVFARPQEVSARLARYGKRPWVFSVSADGAPKLQAAR